jgi:hypothetical protein
VAQLLGSEALPEQWENIGVHTIPEQDKGFYSKCIDPQDSEAVSGFRGPRHGKGDGPASSALKAAPTDLTQLAKRSSGVFPDLKVFNAISGDIQVPAHGSKDMPVWGAVFRHMGDNDMSNVKLRIRNLTKYIESIQAK